MPIYRPSELKELGLRAKKALSQNFLIDQNILKKISSAAHVSSGDVILEIGPGPGALTEHLLGLGVHVYAIEKDVPLAQNLARLQTDDQRLHVIEGDALGLTLDEILPKEQKAKVIANLPYHITTPIITSMLPKHNQLISLTLMMQKEVGERICTPINSRDSSSLTLLANCYSTPTYCFTVKPTSFYPKPRVSSCVVHLDLHPFPFFFNAVEFFKMTRTAFGKKRKMLRASLKELYSTEMICECLLDMGKAETTRPQELTLEEFATFFCRLQESKEKK